MPRAGQKGSVAGLLDTQRKVVGPTPHAAELLPTHTDAVNAGLKGFTQVEIALETAAAVAGHHVAIAVNKLTGDAVVTAGIHREAVNGHGAGRDHLKLEHFPIGTYGHITQDPLANGRGIALHLSR